MRGPTRGPLKVLHVITGLAAGGAEQQLRLLLRHLPADCTVATLTNPGAVAAAIQDEGTPVVDLGMRGNRDVTVMPRLARLMRAGGYDVVHTHLYRACVYGRLAARLARVPHIVATEHSLGDTQIERRPLSPGVRGLYRATERLGDVTIAVSTAVARRLVAWGVPAGRVVTVPNGVDAAELRYDPPIRRHVRGELGIAPEARVVGTVCRLEPTKRLDVLLRAARAIPDSTVLLVGDGSARESLEELARELGMSSRVRFTGERRDVRGPLCAMDVFAAPSPDETFGVAVLEALACGLPVRYVSCPALDELPPGAAPDARRLPLDAGAFAAELAAELERTATRPRSRPPPALGYYDIAQLAGRVAQLYEQLRAGEPPVRHVSPETVPHLRVRSR